MVRISVRAAAVVTLAALFTGSATTAGFAATPAPDAPPPAPIESPTGMYIVLLDEKPAATYDGGQAGLAPTKPDEGQKLDTQAPKVKEYQAFLEKRQDAVAQDAGVQPQATYQTTLNGFSAKMSPQEAAKVAGTKGVRSVVPDEIRHPDAVPSTEFLGLSGSGGVWQQLGGIPNAGKGVVVGVVDTGIAPENPSFAGQPLTTTPGDEPYLDGNTVVFHKSDGTDFRSDRVSGDQWSSDAYSTKIVGAKYFSDGAAAAGFDFGSDILSPRDGAGHGSHTASTAAGNNDIPASVSGIDFGRISGVAPAAKVAAYKACYDGPDPSQTTDDICALSDLLAAIDAAVADGVDVINYSIGGGSATSVLAPDDVSFFNAAVAGVFVSVSAGNSGPGAATADHASPWYTTVAASTIPSYEGTVVLSDGSKYAGATTTVAADQTITGTTVVAADIAMAGAAGANAAKCFPGSIDPAKAAGKIVVCDRGTNARTEKSDVVKAAGGVAMILVNVTPSSVDADVHAIPTVHVDANARDAVLANARGANPTVTLLGTNTTGIVTPVPQVAGFSSRGPMLADGSDVLKPDIAAPGVAILAATNNPAGQAPTFNFLSGTSMAAPHVAGLAALYLGAHPNATPAEIKSAMMTSAYDTVNSDGSANTDPFAQGAGQVDARKYLDPGMLYLNGPKDWAGYLKNLGLADLGVPAIDDPSNLNLASIAIGSLSKAQTVTRTVTSTRAGDYSVTADIPGVNVTVSPSTLSFAAAGESKPYTVTFSNATAPVEQWATGQLTWTGTDGTHVRSPLAVQPVTADAPANVSGTGITGSVPVTIDAGVTGDLALNVSGLAPIELLTDPANPVAGHSGNEKSGDKNGDVKWIVQVPEGSSLAQFTLDSTPNAGNDLDLFVYRIVSPTDTRYYEMWQSATGSPDEQVTLPNPTAGYYMVVVNMYATTGAMTWDLTSAVVAPGGAGSLTATPNPLPVTQGQQATYQLSWAGLQPATRYLGVVGYGDSAVRTLLTVDSGPAAPVATAPPVVSGTPQVGKTLKATAGTWNPADVTVAYQWLRGGQPIDGATSATYKVTKADVGSALSVRVTATAAGNPNAGTATSNELFVKYGSSTKVSMNRYIGTSSQTWSVTVAVTPTGGPAASGTATVWVDSKKYTGTLSNGSVTIDLPKPSRGIHFVVATYAGSDTVSSSSGLTAFLVYR